MSNILFSGSAGVLLYFPPEGVSSQLSNVCRVPENARVVTGGTFDYTGVTRMILPSAVVQVRSYTFRID